MPKPDNRRSYADVRAVPRPRTVSSPRANVPRPMPGHPHVVRIAATFVLAVAVVAGIFFIGSAREFPRSVERSVSGVSEGVRDLQALDTSGARESFGRARDAAEGFSENPFGAVRSFFTGVPELFQSISSLAGAGIAVSEDLDYIETRALEALLQGDGGEIMARLDRIAHSLQEIRAATQSLTSQADGLGMDALFPESIAPFSFDAGSAGQFLAAGLSWLRVPEGRRFAVLFQNPAEMRPAGGFLGSFAEVAMRDGAVVSSTVRDILEADRTFSANIIPPRPLQGMIRRWKAADANWFFDFPISAAHVARFLEGSEFYRRTSTTFDGIIAVSPRVAKDILSRTGPIQVPGVGTLDADNFLSMLQSDVQTRQFAGESFPKQALSALFASLRERFVVLDPAVKQEITGLFSDWVSRRDIMVYVNDAPLQSMIEQYGMGGEVARLPEDFEGDYLAIVDANVGGGKTDGFINQRVTWESQINTDGVVTNHLVLTRNHEGEKSPHSWNRLPNDDYLQVFVPPRAELANFSGGKIVVAPVRPEYRSFASDPLLAEIELGTEESAAFPQVATHIESGKRVFATRVVTSLGGRTQVVLDYAHRLFVNPGAGTQYRFIFERQAGSAREYRFTVSAPVGFRFRETGLPVWNSVTSDPPGRLVVDLTLERVQD